MLLADVADTSARIAATSARSAKTAALAELLARLEPGEIAVVATWLSGDLTQRQIGVGWAALRELPPPSKESALTVAEVEACFTAIGATSGPGSVQRRRVLLDDLFSASTPAEQQFLRRLLGGELRQGSLVGLMTDAVAKASGVPLADVRRAAMLQGDLPAVAALALTEGVAALTAIGLQVGRPVGPMLAQTASGVDDALDRLRGRAVFEAKLDGVRVQIHRDGDAVSLFTRTLDDITDRLPEVVEFARSLPVQQLVADAEVIALRPDSRPERFQVTASRLGSRSDPAAGRIRTPVTPFVFDLLHCDGRDLLTEPTLARLAVLDSVVDRAHRIERIVTDDPVAAGRFLDRTLAAGHEGVMAKSPDSAYEAGRRGAGWLKIKPVHTLDLVVLAVEWGSGRRTGTLSNIHLGARDGSGGFVMLGKTFKGMTDEMLAWQTERFLSLATGPTDGYVVWVRPEQVVEIALDGVQTSSRYPAGMALRFARVVRYRDDKTAAEADTVETVRRLYER